MIVVAGIGNVLAGDDGFGPAVIDALRRRDLPDHVTLVDAGIRTMHLAYDLAEGVDLFIALDTIAADDAPGTVVVLAPDFADVDDLGNGHGMDLHQVWELTHRLGPGPARAELIGCVPASMGDHVGLSPVVAAAVEATASLVEERIGKVVHP